MKEVAYHVERSTDWVIRLGDGTDESHERMQAAIDAAVAVRGRAVRRRRGRRGAASRAASPRTSRALRAPWTRGGERRARARRRWSCPADDWAQRGGKQGVHTEHLGHLLAEMQFLQRAYPDAQW